MTPTNIAERLGESGSCVCTDYLSASFLNDICNDFDRLKLSGDFQPAGIGRNQDRHVQKSVRTDETYWLNRGHENPTQVALWEKLDLLQQAFNRTLFLGLQNFEGHYASYGEGGFYQRHRDSFQGSKGDKHRMVSLIIYLNKNWQESDGGKLRLYGSGSSGEIQDVDPVGGTMVCFMSEDCEHEVLPCRSPRQSFTGWFCRGP